MRNHKPVASCREALYLNNWLTLGLSMAGIVCKVLSGLGFSRFTQKVLDVIAGKAAATAPYLLWYAAGCIALMMLGAAAEYQCWTAFRSKALEQYRAYVISGILRKSANALKKESSDAYLSGLSNDLGQIRDNYLEQIPYAAELMLSFAGTVVLMLYYDLRLACVAFAVSLLPLVTASFRLKEVERCETDLSNANSRFLGAFAELLRGFPTIKSMRAEKQMAQQMSFHNRLASEAYSHRERVEISVAYIAALAGRVSQVAFFFLAMVMSRADSRISVGVIVAFVQMMGNISQLAVAMPELTARIKAARALMEKNDTIMMENQPRSGGATLACRRGIRLENVTYQYDGASAGVQNISMTLPAGGCYAIIGESGSGKSTILNILAGLIRDYSGRVLYDDTELKTVSDDDMMDTVSVVYQDVFLFDASVGDNITLFGCLDEVLAEQAARQSGLSHVLDSRGLGYRCGENGNALSGGEKQRIGIARAILRGTDVLLMDEITSALDSETSCQIMKTVRRLEGKTRIIVTHDLIPEVMEEFDRIFVLQNGKVVESGKYSELMAQKGVCYWLAGKSGNTETGQER